MSRIWNHGLSLAIIGVVALTLVADANAGHRHRRRGCGGCGGYAGNGYYGKGGYGYNGYGYGGGYAGYAPAPGYYGGATYAPAPAPMAGATFNQPGVVGTANADAATIHRSARAENNSQAEIQSNSDLRANVPQGSLNAGVTGNADANLPANPTVAP